MIDPKYLQELIILGMSIKVEPSDVFNHFSVIVEKKQKHPENSTITGVLKYEQLLPLDHITNTDRITSCVKFMMDKIFHHEQEERDNQKKIQ